MTKPVNRGRGNKTPTVPINARVFIDQYKWLREESDRRGKGRDKIGGQFMCEIIREAIDLMRARDNVTIIEQYPIDTILEETI